MFICFSFVIAGAIYWSKTTIGPAASSSEFSSTAPVDTALPAIQNQQKAVDQITAMILAIKTKSDVKPAIAKILQLAGAPENRGLPGVMMLAAMADFAGKLEGFIWRCRPLVDTSDWLHMQAMFDLRNFNFFNYLYGAHVAAVFDYLTSPLENHDLQFHRNSELQDFLAGPEITGSLDKYIRTLSAMDKLPEEAFEFQFDRRLISGVSEGVRFIDPQEAKKMFIKPYLYTMLFVLERATGSIAYLAAYDVNDLPAFVNRLIFKTAINSKVGRLSIGNTQTPLGITPQMMYATMEEFPNFLTLRSDETKSKALLEKSFRLGTDSAYYELAAYVCGIKYGQARVSGVPHLNLQNDCGEFAGQQNPEDILVPAGRKYLFNPNSMVIDFKSKYHALRERYKAYRESAHDQYVTVLSDVTGLPVEVNVHALFKGHRDLKKVLLPNRFQDPGVAGTWVTGKSHGGTQASKTWAWNYNQGRPIGFYDASFGGFFNPSSVRTADDVYRNMTTVLYTDALAPFSAFLRVPSPTRFLKFNRNTHQ